MAKVKINGYWSNIEEVSYDGDGYVAFFKLGNKHYQLVRKDVETDDYIKGFTTTGSFTGVGFFIGGPIGALIGGILGFGAWLAKTANEVDNEGYYEVGTKKMLVSGRIHKGSSASFSAS